MPAFLTKADVGGEPLEPFWEISQVRARETPENVSPP